AKTLPVAEQPIVRGVKCMGSCTTPCSVAITATGKQACLFSHMNPTQPEELLPALTQHNASPIGRIKGRDLPDQLRAKYLCRIPQPASEKEPEDLAFNTHIS
ncbi:MAG: DUF1636 family protein, partial [Alphaproteobacteria bacterium]